MTDEQIFAALIVAAFMGAVTYLMTRDDDGGAA